jgi:hypothetical protein
MSDRRPIGRSAAKRRKRRRTTELDAGTEDNEQAMLTVEISFPIRSSVKGGSASGCWAAEISWKSGRCSGFLGKGWARRAPTRTATEDVFSTERDRENE